MDRRDISVSLWNEFLYRLPNRKTHHARVVVGGGFIGLEMAENLIHQELECNPCATRRSVNDPAR